MNKGQLVIDENVRGLDELHPVLGLLPGARLALSNVVLETRETALTIAGRWSPNLAIPGLADVKLGDLDLKLIVDDSLAGFAPRVTASFAGTLRTPAGTWQVVANADYPDGWRVDVTTGTVTCGSLLALVPGVDVEAWLPPPLRPHLDAARLTELQLRIGFGENYQLGVGLTVGFDLAWELLPERLAVRDTTLHLAFALDQHGLASLDAALRCSTILAGHTHAIQVGLDAGAALALAIEPAANQPPLGLADVAALLGIPDGLAPVENALAELGIRGLQPGKLALIVQLPTLSIVRAQVEVQLVLRELALVGWLAYPDLTIGAGLAPDSQLDLTALARRLWPELPELGPLALTAANIEIAPGSQRLGLAAGFLGDWGFDLGTTRLALTRAKLALTATPSSLGGKLEFVTRLGECRTVAALALPERELSLGLEDDATLELKTLLASFAPADLTLPPEVGALIDATISELALTCNFATGHYELRGAVTLDQLPLGGFKLTQLTGTIELAGVGASLERLVIEFGAGCADQLVPGLDLHEVRLSIAITREPSQPLKWKFGGSVDLTLFDLPRQRLRAELSERGFAFNLELAEPLSWSLPDVFAASFDRLTLTLEREDQGKTRWSFTGRGGLELFGLPPLRGTLGLDWSAKNKGFAFAADPKQAELPFSLPLVPDEPRLTLAGAIGLERLSLFHQGGWQLEAAASFTPSLPPAPPADAGTGDPIDQTLRFLHDVVRVDTAMTAKLTGSSAGVSVRVAGWPRISLPFPVLVQGEITWDHKLTVGLDELVLRLGQTLGGSAKLAFEFPDEINNVFGAAVLATNFALSLSLDQKTGIGLQLEGFPLNLDATGPFKTELDGDRTWTRFTLGEFSLRFGNFADARDRKWLHLDLGELGEVRLLHPRFSFNGVDFFGSGGFELVRPLRIPTAPLRWLLLQIGANELLALIPSHVEPLDIHVLDEQDRFDADAFVDLLGIESLRPAARELAARFERLPAGLRDYLDITIPRQLEMSLAVTPGTGFGVKLDIRAPKDPLKLVWPTPVGIMGLKLRKLGFGETLGGNLLLLDADFEYDVFDLTSLALAVAAPPELVQPIVDTRAIQRKFIVRNLLCLIVYQTQIPIPIPIWIDEIGVRHHGPEGLRGQLSLVNTLGEFSFGKLVRGLAKLYGELKRFFTEPERQLPVDLFSQSGINLGVAIEPGFVQLPRYLGAGLLGREDRLLELSADSLLVPIVNFLKHPRPADLLAAIPLEVRSHSLAEPLHIGPLELQATWLWGTPSELEQLVHARYPFEQRPRDGAVVYVAGDVALPIADSTLTGMAALAVDDRGFATEFRVAGRVGPLLELELAGDLALVDWVPSSSGTTCLTVLGHRALATRFVLADGVLRFEGLLHLFPPNFGFQADATIAGSISKSALDVGGTATISLPLLPATSATLSLSYTQTKLTLDWLDQRWDFELSRNENSGRIRFDARAERPVALLPALAANEPALLTLTGPPMVRLEGPDQPSLRFQGGLALPHLGAEATGDVQISLTRTQALGRARMHGFAAQLTLDGAALDQPTSFTYLARFEGDLFTALANAMHDAFNRLLASAREGVEKARQVFEAAWAEFRALVTKLAQEVRAWLLQTKDYLEQELRKLLDSVGELLESLKTTDNEIAIREKLIDEASKGISQTIEYFEQQCRDARLRIESKDQEIRDLEHWYYHRLDGGGRFVHAAYFGLRWLRLTGERKLLPPILSAAETELARARAHVGNGADDLKQGLAALDRIRNTLLGDLQRAQRAVTEKKGVLDQINEQLRLGDDALAALGQQFGKFVDDTAMKAARLGYDLALGLLAGFDAATRAFTQVNRALLPFEISRLSVAGHLHAQTGARFSAEADVWLHVFEQPRLVENLRLELDFANMFETATNLAWTLWNERDRLQYVDQAELRRRIEHEYQALAAQRERLGDDFGESLDRKLLYEMDWVELIKFYDTREQLATRYPIVRRAATVIETAVSYIEPALVEVYTPRPYHHLVQAGDMLGDLAQRYYGNFDDYQHIFNANRDVLSDPNVLPGGIVLRIPGWQIIEVRSGDALGSIAQRVYGDFNAYQRIFEANRDILSDPNVIYAGQQLRLPGHWTRAMGDRQGEMRRDGQSPLDRLRAQEHEFKARFASTHAVE